MTNLPFSDLEEEFEEIKILNNIIIKRNKTILEKNLLLLEKNDLLEELMNENKGYRDAIDRLNDYISNYEVAIKRFNESNRD